MTRFKIQVGDVLFLDAPVQTTTFKQGSKAEWSMRNLSAGYFKILAIDEDGIQVEPVSFSSLKSGCLTAEPV